MQREHHRQQEDGHNTKQCSQRRAALEIIFQLISKMLGDETILTGSSSRSDGKTTSSHQLMGRPLMSPAQMVRIQRDTWIVEKAGYAPMKTHLEGYWKYLSLAPQEQDTTSENGYLEIKLLSTESLRQALGSASVRPHAPSAATREPRRKLGASRREAAALYPGKFNPQITTMPQAIRLPGAAFLEGRTPCL